MKGKGEKEEQVEKAEKALFSKVAGSKGNVSPAVVEQAKKMKKQHGGPGAIKGEFHPHSEGSHSAAMLKSKGLQKLKKG